MRSATLSHSLPFLTLVLGRLTRMPSHQMQSRRRAFSFSVRSTQFLFIRIPSHRTFLSVYFFLCPRSLIITLRDANEENGSLCVCAI
jgi:hypothetical protein